jgi:hypothetical protein
MARSLANDEDTAAYRWRVTSRVLAAGLGGYAWTSLFTATLALAWSRLLGAPRAEAVLS